MLSPFPLPLPSWSHRHVWPLFIIRADEELTGINRDHLMLELKERGIGRVLHYHAAQTRKFYREKYLTLSLPYTEWNAERMCSLPLFPDISENDVDRLVVVLCDILRK